jgi:hypothetical protein
MTPEQQRKMLECAAKSCGFKKWRVLTSGLFQVSNNENWNEAFAKWTGWNPITSPHDTATMCAKLDINTFYYMSLPKVECSLEDAGDEQVIRYSVGYADNPGEKLKAWMYAATMVAAKIGGYTE